ncbi:ssDNA binding protein [Bacillus phage 000TH008]|nr:ssDNA binding protein [Bacillus phage 000TH008]QQO40816.1 ssDNA binding protein [Bacillus phage 000TH009]
MSFMDIINQETQKIASSGGGENDRVKYPERKQKPLFFAKGETAKLVQIMPSADLQSKFFVPIRKIFLSAVSSQGKQINSNFVLDAEENPGSLLEQKIAEWGGKGLIPNGFGGQQSPRMVFLYNVVAVSQDPNSGTFVQERDQQGNLVIRMFEMPYSAHKKIINLLGDPLYRPEGTSELSFMDVNQPRLVKISKPPKGSMEYGVDVYTNVTLPPSGAGWESRLEDLHANAVPTERLENGDKWVKAFIDMKEGRKPNQSNNQGQTAPVANPYAQQQPPQGNMQVQQQNTYTQQQFNANPSVQQPNVNTYMQHQQPNIAMPTGMQQPPSQPQVTQNQTQPTGGLVTDPLPSEFDSVPDVSNAGADLNPHTQVVPPSQPSIVPNNITPSSEPTQSQVAPTQPEPSVAPTQPNQNTVPTHNVDVNNNGLLDIDNMLNEALNNN